MSDTYEVGVVLDGLGEGSLGLVSVTLPEAVCLEAGEVTTVRARAPGPAAAVSQLVDTVTRAPGAVPLRVDQDLVAVSDIARRLGRAGSLSGSWWAASVARAASHLLSGPSATASGCGHGRRHWSGPKRSWAWTSARTAYRH